MAVPDRSPQEIAAVVHANDAGYSQQGFTLQSKTAILVDGSRIVWEAVATKGPRTWTFTYTTQADGSVGKLYHAVDDQGRDWRADGSGWL